MPSLSDLPSTAFARFGLLALTALAAAAQSLDLLRFRVGGSLADSAARVRCYSAAGVSLTSDVSRTDLLPATTRSLAAADRCLAPLRYNVLLWSAGTLLVLLVVGAGVYYIVPLRKIRRARLSPFDTGLSPQLGAELAGLVRAVGLRRPPVFLLAPDRAANGQAFGAHPRYYVRLGGGLEKLYRKNPDRVRATVLHELGHVRAGDSVTTYATLAVWLAYAALLVGTTVAFVVSGDLSGQALVANLSDWLALAALAYAIGGSVLWERELYADALAARILGDPTPLEAAFRADPISWRDRLNATHPPQLVRRAVLRDPTAAMRLGPWVSLTTGIALSYSIGAIANVMSDLGWGESVDMAAWYSVLPMAPFGAMALVFGVWRARLAAEDRRSRPPGRDVWLVPGLLVGLGLVLGRLLAVADVVTMRYLVEQLILAAPLAGAMVLIMRWLSGGADAWLPGLGPRGRRGAMAGAVLATTFVLSLVLAVWTAAGNLVDTHEGGLLVSVASQVSNHWMAPVAAQASRILGSLGADIVGAAWQLTQIDILHPVSAALCVVALLFPLGAFILPSRAPERRAVLGRALAVGAAATSAFLVAATALWFERYATAPPVTLDDVQSIGAFNGQLITVAWAAQGVAAIGVGCCVARRRGTAALLATVTTGLGAAAVIVGLGALHRCVFDPSGPGSCLTLSAFNPAVADTFLRVALRNAVVAVVLLPPAWYLASSMRRRVARLPRLSLTRVLAASTALCLAGALLLMGVGHYDGGASGASAADPCLVGHWRTDRLTFTLPAPYNIQLSGPAGTHTYNRDGTVTDDLTGFRLTGTYQGQEVALTRFGRLSGSYRADRSKGLIRFGPAAGRFQQLMTIGGQAVDRSSVDGQTAQALAYTCSGGSLVTRSATGDAEATRLSR